MAAQTLLDGEAERDPQMCGDGPGGRFWGNAQGGRLLTNANIEKIILKPRLLTKVDIKKIFSTEVAK